MLGNNTERLVLESVKEGEKYWEEEQDEEEGFEGNHDGRRRRRSGFFQVFLCLRWQRSGNINRKGSERAPLLQARQAGEITESRRSSLWWWMIRKPKMEYAKEIKELLSSIVPNKMRKNIVIVWKLRQLLTAYTSKRRKPTQFQYDPQSYALNFDQGFHGIDDENCVTTARLDFSSRFAAASPRMNNNSGC